MKFVRVAPFVALLLLAACGDSRTVNRPLQEVHAALLSMPAEADAMSLATQFPGTTYFLEPDGGRLIWHFTHNGKDYGRFVAKLSEDGPNATTITTEFEEADDAELAGKLDFLRDIARIAAEASLGAALEGRPVDREAVQARIVQQIGSDPLSAQVAVIETVSAEIDRQVAEQKANEVEPAHVKPGVLPRVGGAGGPRDDPPPSGGLQEWKN